MMVHGDYFCGNKISDYGIKKGYVDYRTLAKSFDAVLNNNILNLGGFKQTSGWIDNSEAIEALRDAIEHYENVIEAFSDNEKQLEFIKNEIKELELEIEELEAEQNAREISQYYIVSNNGAELLERINEIVFYNEELNMYVWGVTHWGTSWDYVLTNIKIVK